jgi:hypothetical protein
MVPKGIDNSFGCYAVSKTPLTVSDVPLLAGQIPKRRKTRKKQNDPDRAAKRGLAISFLTLDTLIKMAKPGEAGTELENIL